MHANASFDYATLRVVPRVEREEFVNAGVILFCLERRYLGCRVHLDTHRLRTLAPEVDVVAVERHLAAFVPICSGDPDGGPMAKLTQRERFHWLTAPRSTMLQVSPVRTGLCPNPAYAVDAAPCDDLDALLDNLVARVTEPIPPDHNSMSAVGRSRR